MGKKPFTAYNGALQNHARELRKNMTSQEKKLWYGYLRNYPIKFYRQRSIGYYIADFYCSKARLVIEVDGSQHFEPKDLLYDEKRTTYFKEYGLEVVRFTNRDIDTNLRGVCDFIDLKIEERLKSAPQSAPERGAGSP